jgi:hypothetical protein
MAPEQAKGKAPNERVDIYALGVMAYEMLSGEPPFVSENFVEVLARKATEPAPPLDRAREDLPPLLVRLVHDCLEIDPTRRPASATELLSRLDAAMSGEQPVVAIDVEARSRPERPGQLVPLGDRRLAPIAAGAPASAPTKTWAWLAAMGLLMVGAIGLWELRPTVPERTETVEPAAIVDDDSTPALVVPPTTPVPVPVDTGVREPPPVEPPPVEPPPVEPPAAGDTGAEPKIDPPPVDPKKPKTLEIESEPCKNNRAAAEVARKARDWSAVIGALRSQRCWTGKYRAKYTELKVKALFEQKDWSGCVRAGVSASDAKTIEIVKGCKARQGG